MAKKSIPASALRLARNTLIEKHEFYGSWAAVSEEYSGLNRGLLCAIANGKRKATGRTLEVMGIAFRVAPRPRRNWKATALVLASVLCLKR